MMGSALGRLFHGGLVQPGSGLYDPQSGQTSVGTPEQNLARLNQIYSSRVSDPLNPGPNLPRFTTPSFSQAATAGSQIPGQANAFSPGLTKAGKLMTLLSSGLQGALAGRAAQEQMIAQTGGRRAGGIGTGFQAGYQLPWQRAIGSAEAQLAQAGLQPVQTPYGQMPARLATQILSPYLRGAYGAQIGAQSREKVAGENIASREDIANKQIGGRMDIEMLRAGLAQGTVARLVPTQDEQGQFVMRAYNKFNQPMGDVNGAVPPASYLPKTSSTVEYKQLDDGSIVALPKSTRTGVALPGSNVPAGQPNQPTGGTPPLPQAGRTITGLGGKPLLGAGASAKNAKWVSWDENGRTVAGPTSAARAAGAANFAEVPAQEIRDITNARHAVQLLTKTGDPKKPETQGVLQLIDSLDKDGKLGVLASRWNSFMTKGIGASPNDDPRIITLINKNMLGDTATMLSHFGAGGGRSPQMLQHFLDLSNSRKMDGVTLRAGTKAMADYMTDRAMIPGQQQGNAGGLQIIRDANGRITGVK